MNYNKELQFIAPTSRRRKALRLLLESIAKMISAERWSALPDEMKIDLCEVCEKPFYRIRTTKRFCSDKCRAKHTRLKKE
jgi:hypothetical protein